MPAGDLRALSCYFLRLGTLGFGGPIALTGAMQRDLVDTRRWITPADFAEGLALAQIAPGPLAAQLAMYIGYLARGWAGALATGSAFVLPSLLMVWALSAAYVAFDGLPWMTGLFYGVGAAVIAIVARAAWKLWRLALARDPLLWIVASAVAIVTVVLEREVVWLFVAGGAVAAGRVHARSVATLVCLPLVTAPVALPPAGFNVALPHIFWFFVKAGALVFGSGLAIVPFLYGGAVQERHWLTDRQFLDAVAVAMITPGPVVITVAFIGYLLRGTAGMAAAAAGVFLPTYIFVVALAPHFRRFAAQPGMAAFVTGVTAAATGAIAGAAIVLARRAWIDPWTVGIGVASLMALIRFRVPELWLIAGAAALGLLLQTGGGG